MVTIYDKPEYWNGDIGYRSPGYADFWDNPIKELAILARMPSSVLDVGCAYGFSVHRLRQLGLKAEGVDISSYALSKAHKEVRPYLHQGSVCDLPFGNKSFDLVFSSGMLEHIDPASLDKAVSEMVRVGKRGLIGVSCKDDKTTNLEEKDSDYTHETVLTLNEWQAWFPADYKIISDSRISWTQEAFRSVAIELLRRR